MITVQDIVSVVEALAPPGLQESYDNSGLLTGSRDREVTGVLVCLDVVPEVLDEAVRRGCNFILSHHPPFFRSMKRFTGATLQERILIRAIREDLVLYACHTNLDSVSGGVNGALADRLGLVGRRILAPREDDLVKLACFVPAGQVDAVSRAIFDAGAGSIGKYDHCSFRADGTGTFRAGEGANPYVGEPGSDHHEPEIRLETILPKHLVPAVVEAMIGSHPYEEVAYDLYPVLNRNTAQGIGLTGELPEPVPETDFLLLVKKLTGLPVLRHSRLTGSDIRKVALCGGSGMSFVRHAVSSGADIYLTSDIKYHDWFDLPDRMVLADIGHFESEVFAINVLAESLIEKFPKFAVCLTEVNTNPIIYL
jgi:dinuclear metal center YbgI/SA1388 family protein